MVRTISMEGLDIFIDGPVIEMRTHGIRRADSNRDSTRLFAMVRTDEIKGVIFDGRDAIYQLSPVELEERCRLVARMCQGRTVAYVAKPEQDDQVKQVVIVHQEMGSECQVFRSKAKARLWMDEIISACEVE